MNSRCNVLVSVALPVTWRVAPHWELSLTPNYTHFSNGDTSFSNSGANLFGVSLGATYLFDAERIFFIRFQNKEATSAVIYSYPGDFAGTNF
jgi:hypothetical protein